MNYDQWPREKLIKECRMLREGLHKLAQSAQTDRIRLQMMERTRKFLHGDGVEFTKGKP